MHNFRRPTACADGAAFTNVVLWASKSEGYQAFGDGECDYSITTFGPVGSPIVGTFTAKLKQFDNEAFFEGSGAFNVIRTK